MTRWLVEQRGMDKHEVQVMIGKDYAGDTRHIQSPELIRENREKREPRNGQHGKGERKSLTKRQAMHATGMDAINNP